MSTKKIYLVILGHQTSTQENAFKVISKGKKKKKRRKKKKKQTRAVTSVTAGLDLFGVLPLA